MREQLLDAYFRSTGLFLQPTRVHQSCAYSLGGIPEGDYGVSIKTRNNLIWLSIEAIDDLALALERFDHRECDPGDRIHRDRTNVTRARCKGTKECPVCAEGFGYNAPAIKFTNPKNVSREAYIHPGCVDEFVGALDNVWNHADVLLPQRL